MPSQVKETIKSLLEVSTSDKKHNLFETRLILDDHFNKKSETIEAVKFRQNQTESEGVPLTQKTINQEENIYLWVASSSALC